MHHQVGVGQLLVDRLDHAHRQNVAGGLARKLVSPVRGAAGNRQRIDLGATHEIDRLIGIGQKLAVIELADRAVAILGLAFAGFQRPQNPQLALDRSADPVRHARDPFGDCHVVVVAGRGLGIAFKAAVHHHRGEAVLDRRHAGGFVVAVVLVHAQRDLRVDRRQRLDHLGQHDVVGVVAGPARGLDDDRRVNGFRRLHDRQPLLHVVDVERGHPVAVLGRVIQQLS